jgi:uncharacterized protein involved in outer membrane biogenesis
MQRRKRILLWIAAASGAFLILALALQILIPRLIDLEPVRDKIQNTLSKAIDGKVTFERLDITILPRPSVNARLLLISKPGVIEGTIGTLSIYPRILPLFTGKLRLAQIEADEPDITVRIPEKPAKKRTEQKPDTFAAFREAIAAAGKDLASRAPSLVLLIESGKVTVSYGRNPPITAEQLEARLVLPPQGLSIDVECSTSFWKNLSINAKLDMQTLAGGGSLSVEEFQPHMLNPYLFPDGKSVIGDSLVDLDLSFKTEGVNNFQADATGSAPHLQLRRSRQALLIEDAKFRGSIVHDERKTTITLDQFKAGSPRIALNGTMQSDVTVPLANLTVTGKNIDVQALRQAILFIAPDSSTVQSIFDVLRAGTVPAITLTSTGKTPSDLGDVDHMRITGKLQNGRIEIPGTPFKLINAAGNADISKGILYGDQLTARFGNTTAKNGTMRLGLRGGDAPFHLDIMMEADLAQLPPVLKAFVSDPRFTHELNELRNVKGIARGQLILGESTQSIKTTADISSFELSAEHLRIPFPVELRGGRFFYDEKNLSVEHIQGNVGKSSFTELAARLNLTAPLNLEITSAQFKLVLDELYHWLRTFKPIKEALDSIETVQGAALLSIQRANLPLAKPEALQFSATGSLKNLKIGLKDFPGPLTFAEGSFKADAEKISFTNADADLLDASLTISGRLDGYLKTIRGGELTVTGTLGEEAMHWLSKKFNLPSELAVHTHDISQARIAWQGTDTVSCTGTFTVRKGPSVTLDVIRDPHKLAINALRIQDGDNQADIRLKFERKILDLAFSGTLLEKTLKKIFANERFHYGRISGNFQTHIPLDQPRLSTAHGTFEGEHLLLYFGMKIPTAIDSVSLKADGSTITVGSAKISFGETRLSSTGTISASSAGYFFDGDLSADKVAADTIAEELGKEVKHNGDKQAQKKSQKNAWNLPLRGTVRFSADSISYGKLSAGPVRADINVDSNDIRAAVSEATLCGISLPGTVSVSPADIKLDFSPAAEGQSINSSFSCLGSKIHATGTFNVKGQLMAQGTAKKLLQSLQGKVAYTANNGLIYYDSVTVKILSFLSVNELVSGKLPDPAIDGVPYSSITLKGTIKQGIINVSEYSVDGPVVDIAGQGSIDIVKKTLDLTVVVAPLTTTTAIVKNIPGVSYVMGGTLVTFPLHVYGPFDKVTVSYNPVTAVGEGIFGIMKRIVTIPLIPFESKKKEE